jgi:hypothetical protein
MNQPNDQGDLGSTPQNVESRLPEAEEQDWWLAENEPGRKQFRSWDFRGTYAEVPEKPKKRARAYSRRSQHERAE